MLSELCLLLHIHEHRVVELLLLIILWSKTHTSHMHDHILLLR